MSTAPWEWRLALNHDLFDVDGVTTFHAYDVNDNATCEPCFGLVNSIAEPNEGSNLCRDCMIVVHRQPRGREKRKPAGGFRRAARAVLGGAA